MQPSKIFIWQSTRKQFRQLSQPRSKTSKNVIVILTSTGLIFDDLFQCYIIIVLGPADPERQLKFFQKIGCQLPWLTKKNLGFQTAYLNCHIWHSVNLGTDPNVANHNPANLSVSLDTEKRNKFFCLNFSIPGNLQAHIILTCCTYLAITFTPISEQSKTCLDYQLCNRTKVSHN